MEYINPCLLMVVIATLIAGLILAIEPRAARLLAQILIARAAAVTEARRTYKRVRQHTHIMMVEEEER